MLIFVINSGSSSLKFQLFNGENGEILAKGICDHICKQDKNGLLVLKTDSGRLERHQQMPNHEAAIEAVLRILQDPRDGVIQSVKEISAVGHRVLHGGPEFRQSCLIDQHCLEALEAHADMGPLHYRANLMGIEACRDLMPQVPQVAVFDTAFHSTMPPKAYRYAIPAELEDGDRLRRHGFHGTSHRYIAMRTAELLGRQDLKLCSCHLGSGSSIVAIENGQVQDVSMGMSPLSGIPMGTRSGDIDVTVVQYLCDKYHMTIDQCINILNKQSGMLALSEHSPDFRDLEQAAAQGDQKCQLALDKFCYEAAKYIGAYAAALNGLDALVFTAGVGSNSPYVRSCICEYLGFLGIRLDPERNEVYDQEARISGDDSRVQVWVIPSNEELVIARDTADILKAMQAETN